MVAVQGWGVHKRQGIQMKCGSYVVREERRRKGSAKPYIKTIFKANPYTRFIDPDMIIEPEWEICGGEIRANISAYDEPYYGGTSARLDVQYKCQECGETTFHELPRDDEGLSEFLTRIVADLSDEFRDEALRARWIEQKRQEEMNRIAVENLRRRRK
jgi:hypothetical protein